jgi:hypothetical protein
MEQLQLHARSLCEQLRVALAASGTASHMGTDSFGIAGALTGCLEEQHECGLQVVRQVCLQVTFENWSHSAVAQ